MYEQILPWVGLGVLFILCLPISPIQKLVLEVSAWALRLGMIALLAAGVYLWFRPGNLPAEVSAALSNFPQLLSWLPDQATPQFGLCFACCAVALLVPLLAVLDVSRKLAGRRLCQLRRLAATQPAETRSEPAPSAELAPLAEVAPPTEPAPSAEPAEQLPVGVPILRPVVRRTAAQTIASAAPLHTAH
jgi:hypothetical protein